MSRTTIFVVSDDHNIIDKVKSDFGPQGVTVSCYSPYQWRESIESPAFRNQLAQGMPALATGSLPVDGQSTVVSFSQGSNSSGKVSTMNELESKAIENAITQYRGNLTEAAKALGIGRATLYRKVKQYQIDPASARKRSRAA